MRGISQNPTFSVVYKNTRHVRSSVFVLQDVLDQGK